VCFPSIPTVSISTSGSSFREVATPPPGDPDSIGCRSAAIRTWYDHPRFMCRPWPNWPATELKGLHDP